MPIWVKLDIMASVWRAIDDLERGGAGFRARRRKEKRGRRGSRRGSEPAALALASGCKRAEVSRIVRLSRASDEEPASSLSFLFSDPAHIFADVESLIAC